MADAGHGHGTESGGRARLAGGTSARRLALVSAVNLLGFVVEFAGGLLFGSVALLGDAVHMLFDALVYVMAFAAAYAATRYEGGDRWSYGFHRLEPLSAFLNGLLLLPMVGFVLWESYRRFLDPVAVGVGPTLAVAAGGLLVNVASVIVLGGEEMGLNERGAFYHLLGDAAGSVAVIVATVAVAVTGARWVDPLAAVLVAGLVVHSAGKVLAGSGAIFLQRTPLDVGALRAAVAGVDGVAAVEDVHAWRVCSHITVATVHATTDADSMAAGESVIRRIHGSLADHGVDHATVELRARDATVDDRLDSHDH